MNPNRIVHSLLALLLLLLSLVSERAIADSAPQLLVRAHLEPSGPVVAGTQVKLVVDCLTTTWFTEAPDWPLFTVPGAIVSLPDEQAENLHEIIDGVSWFGVSRAYRITPQAANAFDIPSFAIPLHPGGTSGPLTLMTPPLKLMATVPAGAEGMRIFFPTPKLSATQKIEPSPAHLKVGDSVTRTIVQNAAGTESMLIPPVDFGDIDGLRRNPTASATKNVVLDRAGLVAGERTDSVTYVIERSGKFKFPAVRIEWWNTGAQRRETIVLPAASFPAARPNEKPLFDIPLDAMSRAAAHKIIVIDARQAVVGGVVLVLILLLAWGTPRAAKFAMRLRQAAVNASKRRAQGDAPAWRALCSAARTGSLQRVIPALYRWMDRSPDFGHPARLDRLDQLDVKGLVDTVAMHYAERTGAQLQWHEAKHALRRAARRARKKRSARSALAALNEALEDDGPGLPRRP
jgi:hypothetical protein